MSEVAGRMAIQVGAYHLQRPMGGRGILLAGVPGALTPQQNAGRLVFIGPGRCVLCHGGPLQTDQVFHNVGVLPIVDNDRIVGVVTDRDLVVRALARGADVSTTRVRDCASTTVVSARPHWSLDEALRVMAECRIGRLPVVDDDKTVIGMVTLSSLALRSPRDDETLQAAREVSRRSTRAA